MFHEFFFMGKIGEQQILRKFFPKWAIEKVDRPKKPF